MNTMTKPPSERLLTVKDLAELIGLSEATIYRKRSLGEPMPPAIRLGANALRWRRSDVEAWIESCLEATEA